MTTALAHHAVLYRTDGEYLAGVLPFLHAGVTAREPMLVAVPGPRIDLLRRNLDGAAAQADLVDMAELGRNPARIIPAIRRFTDAHAGRRARFVGEPIWPGRSAAETGESTRHEALINLAFAETPVTILCPYDAGRLPAAVIADAGRTHPHLLERGERRVSRRYTDPAVVCALTSRCPNPPPTPTSCCSTTAACGSSGASCGGGPIRPAWRRSGPRSCSSRSTRSPPTA